MPTDEERHLAQELRLSGFIVCEHDNNWFVGYGSHGGSAYSLRKAVKKCLRCCKIGLYGMRDGERLGDIAGRIMGFKWPRSVAQR